MFLKQKFSKTFKDIIICISHQEQTRVFKIIKLQKKDIIKILLSTNLLRDVLCNRGRMNTYGTYLGSRDSLDQLSSSYP